MSAKRLFAKLASPIKNLFKREHSTIDRERLALLLACYVPIMAIGVLVNFLGLTEPSADFFKYTHTACIAFAILYFCLYCLRKISIKVCLGTFNLLGQTIISIEMIYCAMFPSNYYILLIMANMVLLALNTMVAVSAYMRYNTIILGVATILVYVACAFITGDKLLKSFIAVFTMTFFFVMLVGVLVSTTAIRLEKDNEKYKRDEEEILSSLRMKKGDIRTMIKLASAKYDHDGTKMLMDRFDTKTRMNLLNNVEEYVTTRKTDLDKIAVLFPELTPSEREICRLILQGKRQNEICMILKKSESNVNSQRANMRRKLNLNPGDNLQQKLQERLDEQ